MNENKKEDMYSQSALGISIADAEQQRKEINENLLRKDYLVTVFQAGDKTMSTGEWERQDAPRRYYQHCSLQDLPKIIEGMQIGYWRHPDLKEDLSNADEIPFEEKLWGINHSIVIEPLTRELQEEYLRKVEGGFFETYRGAFERKNKIEKEMN